MSISTLIVIQLVFLLAVSWFVAVVAIRKLRKVNDEQTETIRKLKRGNKRSAFSLDTLPYDELSIDTEYYDDSSTAKVEDISSVLDDLGADFERSSDGISELDAMLKAQSDSISRMRKMREVLEQKQSTEDAKVLTGELKILKTQNKQSKAIINDLNRRLDTSQLRMKAVQRQMTRLKADNGMVVSLERENKRLLMDRSKLEQRLNKEMYKHQHVIERIQAQLSIAEKRSNQGIEKSRVREQKLLSTITSLQEKLRAENAAGIEQTEVQSLKDELDHAQEALNRAISEKEFLESNFLDLEKALQESVSAKEELARTKKEYEMLESHFLALDEQVEQQRAKNDADLDICEYRKNIEKLAPVEVAIAKANDAGIVSR